MSENNALPQDSQPQGSSSGFTTGTDPTSQPAPAANTSVESRVAACDKLVNNAVEGVLSAIALTDSLKNLGLTAIKASDYINKYKQRLKVRQGKTRASKPPSRVPTPKGLSPDEINTFRRDQDKQKEGVDDQAQAKAVKEAAWAQLKVKLESSAVRKPAVASVSLNKMLELLKASQDLTSPSSLLKFVLAVAPHLTETQPDAAGKMLRELIANSIWHLVILDKYDDFEKLYATLDLNYDHNNEAKDLNNDFSLLKKHVISAKHPFSLESEWMRLFDAWMVVVLVFYPHRWTELKVYQEIVVDMFHATTSPIPVIHYNHDVRKCFSMQPGLHLPRQHRLPERNTAGLIMKGLINKSRLFATIGTWAAAKVTRAGTVTVTMSVVSAAVLMGPRIKETAVRVSPANVYVSKLQQLEAASSKAREARAHGVCSLKRKVDEHISEIPRYSSCNCICNSFAISTIAPVQRPRHTSYIRVETPFNIEPFESLLVDHPNQPFVKSVMDGLHYGFWLFDEGKWKDDSDDALRNYATEETNIKAIQAFQDDKIEA
ncbi:hypothetical protein DXG01_011140 [Tephrocybe rancida]|nr:hypothetical protein DXG01_011140 [Tephrocybe rancida]